MTPDDPRHGTLAGDRAHYKAGQKPCTACRTAARRYRKHLDYRIAQGHVSHVPLGQEAFDILVAFGNDAEAAKATGLIHQKVWKLRNGGPTTPVLHRTQAKILNAPRPVPLIGLQRRLKALSALGWSMLEATRVAASLGHRVDVETFKRLRRAEHNQVISPVVRDGVLAAYDALSMKVPENNRSSRLARALAVKAGYLPPLAWDDIDDPNEKPSRANSRPTKDSFDEIVVERVLAGDRHPMTYAERREVVRRALALGWSERRIQDVTGIAKATAKNRYQGDEVAA